MSKFFPLLIIAAPLTAFAVPADAATPVQQSESYYCQTGTFLLLSDDKDETLHKIYDTCKPGDTIGIAEGSVGVQRICDFTKTIQIANRLMVCVLAPLRPMR